jgi:hypothetical protein
MVFSFATAINDSGYIVENDSPAALTGRRSLKSSASREMIKQILGVCFVSIIGEHYRDERELSVRARRLANYGVTIGCAGIADAR